MRVKQVNPHEVLRRLTVNAGGAGSRLLASGLPSPTVLALDRVLGLSDRNTPSLGHRQGWGEREKEEGGAGWGEPGQGVVLLLCETGHGLGDGRREPIGLCECR